MARPSRAPLTDRTATPIIPVPAEVSLLQEEGSPSEHRRVIGVQIKLPCRTRAELAKLHGADLSHGVFFIRTRAPKPVGTQLRFDMRLSQGESVLRGIGRIVRTVSEGESTHRAGMLLELAGLDAASHLVLSGLGCKVDVPTIRTRVSGDAASRRYMRRQRSAPPPPPSDAEDEDSAPEVDHYLISGEMDVQPSPPAAGAPPGEDFDEPRGHVRAARPPGPALEPRVEIPPAPPIHAPAASAAKDAPLPPPMVRAPDRHPPAAIPEHDQTKRARPHTRTRTGHVLAVDFGTSRVVAGRMTHGHLDPAVSREGDTFLPAAFSADTREREMTGPDARALLLRHPDRIVLAPKRLLGRPFHAPIIREIQRTLFSHIVQGSHGEAAVRLHEKPYEVPDICGRLMAEVADWARARSAQSLDRAVLTVPACFNALQRQALLRSAEAAGLSPEGLITEPAAAAIAFSRGRRWQSKLLVYRFGAGSFDASVIQLRGGHTYEVLATGGDPALGGMEFDQRLVGLFLERFEKERTRSFRNDAAVVNRFWEAAEVARIALSTRPAYNVAIPFIPVGDKEAVDFDTTLTREEIENTTADLVDRSIRITAEVLSAARLRPGDIGEVLAVGGVSQMPLARLRLRQLFGRDLATGVPPVESILAGAALLAHGLEARASGAPVVREVLGSSIGIGLPGGGFRRVLSRNAPLPCAGVHVLTTTRDNQRDLDFRVFQGESDQALDNDFLGRAHLAGLPPAPHGNVKIEVKLAASPDGCLRVSARVGAEDRETDLALSLGESLEDLQTALEVRAQASPAPRRAVWSAVRRIFNP
jgi:molecular chaperone DnaK